MALLYAAFTIFFVATNYTSQEVQMQSQIYQSVVKRYTSMPWTYEPLRYLDDVNSPSDLAEWMSSVFITLTFADQPTNGSPDYCTTLYQCEEAQGNCNADEQCTDGLTCGDKSTLAEGVEVNGVYYSTTDLVDYCAYMGTPVDITAQGGVQQCAPTANRERGLPQCCTEPTTGQVITQLVSYTNATVPVVASNCPLFMSADSSCCTRGSANYPARDESTQHVIDAPVRSATMGSFNRIVGIRLGMKRFRVRNRGSAKKWTDVFPNELAGGGQAMSPFGQNGKREETDPFCSNKTAPGEEQICYAWATNGSYNSAGYYTVFIDPAEGEAGARQKLSSLVRDEWFTLGQAVFVADIIVYNGNPDTDAFVHASFIFRFQFSGLAAKSQEFSFFNLNYFNFANPKYASRFMCELVLMIFVLLFFGLELSNMASNVFSYISHPAHLVDLCSLVLSTVVLLGNWCFQVHPLFSDFKFADLQDPATRGEMWMNLEEVAYLFAMQSWFVAFNMLMLVLRAIFMASNLHVNLGLMLKVLDAAMNNLLYFFFMFLMIMGGFSFFAFFTFGTDYEPMSDPLLCLLEVFTMIFGNEIYPALEEADRLMAPIFFYTFYVLFYLVMLNMFVSIIMSGYDIVVEEVEKKLEDERKASKGGGGGPFAKVFDDARADVFYYVGMVLGAIFSVAKTLMSPLTQALKDCYKHLGGRKHSFSLPKVWRNMTGHGPEGGENEENRETDSLVDDMPQTKRFPRWEFIRMLIFMVNFIMFSQFQVRGVATYTMRQSTLYPALNSEWVTDNPKRNMMFDNLSSFEDVYPWLKASIKPLYRHPACAYYNASDKSGYLVPGEICDSELRDRQLVQVVNGWNIGFLRTTFVRLTVVPSCFEQNAAATWSDAYPMVRKGPTISSVTDNTCLTSGGEVINLEEFWGNWSEKGGLGPVDMKGGYAFSLGVTEQQCEEMAEYLFEHRVFTKNTARMSFDWVMYNGNLDMFTYNRIDFVLRNTGEMSVRTKSQAFPLNLIQGGGADHVTRIVNIFLFALYFCFVVFYVWELIMVLIKKHGDQLEKDPRAPPHRFLLKFLSDYWNISDTLSLILSILSIGMVFAFYFNAFRSNAGYKFSVDAARRYPIPNKDATKYMNSEDDPSRPLQEDWYIFSKFEFLQQMYDLLLTTSGLNSFFIAIKTVKYVGMLEAVKVFSFTLARGKTRITYFLIINLMMMLGFALFVSVVFGPTSGNNSLNSPPLAALTLFGWIVGNPDLTPFIKYNTLVAVITFVAFMVLFYFISLQLFLATMLNTYAKEMGVKDKKKEKEAVESKKSLRVVEYNSVDEFYNDVTLADPTPENEQGGGMLKQHQGKDSDKDQKYQYTVKLVQPEGKAARFNVQKDHIVLRVNGTEDFTKLGSKELLYDMMRRTTIKEVSITFKDKQKEGGGLLGNKKDDELIPATVKNLWASCGAVTWIFNQVEQEEQSNENCGGVPVAKEPDPADDDDDADGDEDHENEGEGEQRDQQVKVKNKTKKRLDLLLFSRWIDNQGRREPTEHETCPLETENKGKWVQDKCLWREPVGGYANKDEEEELGIKKDDKDFLKARMDRGKVTGEEVWLDILITAIEKEMENKEYSLIPEVFRSQDTQEGEQQGSQGPVQGLDKLKENVNLVLKVLEYKAKKMYYDYLKKESEEHVHRLDLQNQYLHEYVWELETDFGKIMSEIHNLKSKKDSLLRSLAGVLDRTEYAMLEKR